MGEPNYRQVLVYALCLLVVAAVGYKYIKQQEQGSQREKPAPAALRVSSPPRIAVVHVAGAVRHPGVFRLTGGRVGDAVEKAGGPSKGADLNAINLAAKITDGQQVVVPSKAAAAGAGVPASESQGGVTASGAKISLNTATKEELDTLEGVGPATADKILDYRREHGGFGLVDDLKEITGIGDKKFEALKDSVQP